MGRLGVTPLLHSLYVCQVSERVNPFAANCPFVRIDVEREYTGTVIGLRSTPWEITSSLDFFFLFVAGVAFGA